MSSNPGRIVKTKKGLIGRTFNNKEFINQKTQVFLATGFTQPKGEPKVKIAVEFDTKAILCKPETLTVIGFID